MFTSPSELSQDDAEPLAGADDVYVFPTSFAQDRLWFADQLAPGSVLYNIPAAFRLRGPLDPALLEQALNEIVARHEVLRTTFVAVDGSPVQAISPTLPPTPHLTYLA